MTTKQLCFVTLKYVTSYSNPIWDDDIQEKDDRQRQENYFVTLDYFWKLHQFVYRIEERILDYITFTYHYQDKLCFIYQQISLLIKVILNQIWEELILIIKC